MKNELFKILSHKISVTERDIAFRRKRNLKQCQKDILYEYILAFAGWWSTFWEMVGSGGYVLGDGGWWLIYFGRWWVVVHGGGYILDGGGSWWVLVGGVIV